MSEYRTVAVEDGRVKNCRCWRWQSKELSLLKSSVTACVAANEEVARVVSVTVQDKWRNRSCRCHELTIMRAKLCHVTQCSSCVFVLCGALLSIVTGKLGGRELQIQKWEIIKCKKLLNLGCVRCAQSLHFSSVSVNCCSFCFVYCLAQARSLFLTDTGRPFHSMPETWPIVSRFDLFLKIYCGLYHGTADVEVHTDVKESGVIHPQTQSLERDTIPLMLALLTPFTVWFQWCCF